MPAAFNTEPAKKPVTRRHGCDMMIKTKAEGNMALKLIRLTRAYEKQLGEMIDEWKADQVKNRTNGARYEALISAISCSPSM